MPPGPGVVQVGSTIPVQAAPRQEAKADVGHNETAPVLSEEKVAPPASNPVHTVTESAAAEEQKSGPLVSEEQDASAITAKAVSSDPVAESPVSMGDAPAEAGDVEQVGQSADQSEIDADLATTLGRPKVSSAPTGKLGALLGGRSVLVPDSVTGEGGEGEGLSDTSHLKGDYDHDRVMSAWADLIQDLRDKNKLGMAATLATGGLTFQDPALKLVVANDVQYEELKECATELLHFIRVKVGNGGIAFEVEVGEEVAAPKFLTPKDRYQHWAADNPALEELRVRLDLDLG